MLHHEPLDEVGVLVVRVNASTDLSRAPCDVRDNHGRSIDHVDERMLPLGRAGTLPGSLSLAIMREVPQALGVV